MVKVILVAKNKNKKCSEIKNFKIQDLFKKCNLRKNDNFEKRHTWKINSMDCFISLFAKNKGRANSENKYELPPPIDSELYYGMLLIVKHVDKDLTEDNVENLSLDDWEKAYEELFGGFEDLTKESEEEEDELENVPEEEKTKEGYLKDGFVVDDEEEEDDSDYIPEQEKSDDEDENDEDEEEEIMGTESDIESYPETDTESDEQASDYDSDIGSELSEESYIDSDSD